jgi:hypothetical protein
MTDTVLNPLAPNHLPWFITPPGEADMLSVFAGIFLIVTVLIVGTFYLKLHSLPERSAHAGRKIQFELVAILGLLSLFTHNHLFWVAALLLAFIDIPDFAGPLRSMAASLGRLSGRGGDETKFADFSPGGADAHAPPTSSPLTPSPPVPSPPAPLPLAVPSAQGPEPEARDA